MALDEPAGPKKLESSVRIMSAAEPASANSSADGDQRPDCKVCPSPSGVVLLLGGGKLIVAAPAGGGSTTVSEFFGAESGGSPALKLIVAAPTSLTVNSRPHDGQLFGISS